MRNFQNEEIANEEVPPNWLMLVVTSIITIHIGILVWLASVNSPNIDELAHLPSGINHWEYGKFDLYRVNPPLVRMVAAAPVMLTDAVLDWSKWEDSPYSRSEFWVGKSFTKNNGFNTFWYFSLARFACIPFSVLGCVVSYCWAKELYGWKSGLIALSLYAFSPNLMAWGASITPDAGSASTGLFATWMFWKWLIKPTWKTTLWCGSALGLALLTKSTWIFFLIIFPIMWISYQFWSQKSKIRQEKKPVRQIAVILLLGIYILNLGYGFEGSFTPLGNFRFVSESLSGQENPPHGANRFTGTVLGAIPVPLPGNFLRGIDVQKYDFERGKWSYLCGEQKRGGWWYYYIYGFLVKTPIGYLMLIFFSWLSAILLSQKPEWRPSINEWFLLVPAFFVLVLVSSQTGFNRYYRYVLPALPFFFIFTSRIAKHLTNGSRLAPIFYGLLLLGIVESISVLPHSLSFFNVAVGGPLGGPRHLLDGNIDWGQDLLFLKKWYDNNPECRPFHVTYFSDWDIAPEIVGIESKTVPRQDPEAPDSLVLAPGWYAVSVNQVYGYHYFENDKPFYEYFKNLKPVARAGYSIYIYRVDK